MKMGVVRSRLDTLVSVRSVGLPHPALVASVQVSCGRLRAVHCAVQLGQVVALVGVRGLLQQLHHLIIELLLHAADQAVGLLLVVSVWMLSLLLLLLWLLMLMLLLLLVLLLAGELIVVGGCWEGVRGLLILVGILIWVVVLLPLLQGDWGVVLAWHLHLGHIGDVGWGLGQLHSRIGLVDDSSVGIGGRGRRVGPVHSVHDRCLWVLSVGIISVGHRGLRVGSVQYWVAQSDGSLRRLSWSPDYCCLIPVLNVW